MPDENVQKWRAAREERRFNLLQFGSGGRAKAFLLIKRDAKRIARKFIKVKRKRGRPEKGVSLQAQAISLLRRCQSAGLPPPEALVELFIALTGANEPESREKPKLTKQQWAGLYCEVKYEFRKQDPEKKDAWVVDVQATQVARRAKVSSVTVAKWRRNPEYHRGLVWIIINEPERCRKVIQLKD
jgi:hypothetical protein